MISNNTPNKPELLAVGELTKRIRSLLESGFSFVRVSGEVSRFTQHKSGHAYFTIKDADASLDAVIWRSSWQRLRQKPERGKSFIFSGHLSLYPPQGRYQLIVTVVQAAGEGAFATQFERNRQLFAQRGWFAAENKKTLPTFPKHIGIITSSQAAALADVRKVLASRPQWLRLTLSPTVVQGKQAPEAIQRAFVRLRVMDNPPDVILLVRGGGSVEDLWCFNDEKVVQAIYSSSVPVITGIGHDIDHSLSDLAADVRTATPSHAAAIVYPDCATLAQSLPSLHVLATSLQHSISTRQNMVEMLFSRAQKAMQRRIDDNRMTIDHQTQRLNSVNPLAVLARGYALAFDDKGNPLLDAKSIRQSETVSLRLRDGEVSLRVLKK
ncbi:MAG: exodeoxyribonuclease VII large subunit [Mariprofundales bacterium]